MNEMTPHQTPAGDSFPSRGSQGIETLTPEQLGGEIRLLTSQARRMVLSYAIEIGHRLVVAKEKVAHGEWIDWVARETDFSQSGANRMMRLYEEYGSRQESLFGAEANSSTLKNLSISNALRLLAVPEEEREEVAAELDAEHLSTRELERALAERDEARKALQDTSARLEQAEKTLAGARDHETELNRKLAAARDDLQAADTEFAENERVLKERIRELESRPVEVAVERDEEAIRKAAEDARKAAEDAARAEMDKLRKKLEAAEKAREKAEAEKEKILRSAQDDKEKEAAKAEAEQAKAEAEALRKKLVSAESGAGIAATLFSLAQQNFNSALEKVIAMKATHPDVAGKLLAGMEEILGRLVEKVKGARG